jgi:hypothetical protein
MSESNPIPGIADKQEQPEVIPARVLDWATDTMLDAQVEMLAGAETTVTDWLRRRHEAILDTRQLICGMHLGADPAETFKVQRDFVSRSFQRLTAEANACQSATQQLVERALAWFPGGWVWLPLIAAGSVKTAASQAAATRAAGRPLRMANKSDAIP